MDFQGVIVHKHYTGKHHKIVLIKHTQNFNKLQWQLSHCQGMVLAGEANIAERYEEPVWVKKDGATTLD